MQTGLHAIGWSMQRLAIAFAGLAFAAIVAYVAWIFVIVAVQAVAGLNH